MTYILIFLDLLVTKAIDGTDNSILKIVLHFMVSVGLKLSLLKVISHSFSRSRLALKGIPQGSITGPLVYFL